MFFIVNPKTILNVTRIDVIRRLGHFSVTYRKVN